MRTDTIFYQLFQLFPDLLTDLLGENQTGNYSFTSVEVKELSRRIDGVFLPPNDAPGQRMYFAEVQFQKDDTFYERLMTETFLFLGQYRPHRLWRSVAICARRGLDDCVPLHYRELQDLGLLQVVYLDELAEGGLS